MMAKIPGVQLPSGATVDFHVQVTASVKITPFAARQRVNVFVKMEVSSQCRSEEPELIIAERLCWSVPVSLTFPDRGSVGKVGEILVDARTGELLVDEDTVRKITENAVRFARSCYDEP
jgi:hypothetical protein